VSALVTLTPDDASRAGFDAALDAQLDRLEREPRKPRRKTDDPPAEPAIPIIVPLEDVAPLAIDWLWPGRLARGMYTLVAGDPGVGKSTLTIDLAARLSRGADWPDGGTAPQGDVLILSAEDSLAHTIRPRCDRAGADVRRVHVLQAVLDATGERPINLARDLAVLVDAVRRVTPILVIVDPITAYLGRTDAHRDGEVRGLLAPLIAELDRAQAALIAVGHLSKDAQRAALHRPGGSIAFVAAARIALAVASDPDAPERRAVASLKNNLAAPPPTLAFRFDPSGRLVWDIGPIALTAESLLAPRRDSDGQTDAEAVIRELLDDDTAWPLDAKRALEAGQAHGVPDRTMRWTAKKLGIRIRRTGFGGRGRWTWERPDIPATALTEHRNVAPIATMREPEQNKGIEDKEVIKKCLHARAREIAPMAATADADWFSSLPDPPGHHEAAARVAERLAAKQKARASHRRNRSQTETARQRARPRKKRCQE
jgi:hypothetical protein